MLVMLDTRKNKFQSQKETILHCLDFFYKIDQILDIRDAVKQMDEISQQLETIILYMLKKKTLLEDGKKSNLRGGMENFKLPINKSEDFDNQKQISNFNLSPVKKQKMVERPDEVFLRKKNKIRHWKDRLEYDMQNDLWRSFYFLDGQELKFLCKECNENFQGVQELFRHTIVKHKLDHQKFNCTKCRKSFHSQIQLYLHVRYEHNKELMDLDFYQCDVCGKTVRSYGQLRSHVELMHLSEIWNGYQDFLKECQMQVNQNSKINKQ